MTPGDAEFMSDMGWSMSVSSQSADTVAVNPSFPTRVDASELCAGYPFGLTFAAQVGLKLCEHSKHVEEGLTCCRRRIDGLLG